MLLTCGLWFLLTLLFQRCIIFTELEGHKRFIMLSFRTPSLNVFLNFCINLFWSEWRNHLSNDGLSVLSIERCVLRQHKIRYHLFLGLFTSTVIDCDVRAFDFESVFLCMVVDWFRLLDSRTINKCKVSHWSLLICVFVIADKPNFFYFYHWIQYFSQFILILYDFQNSSS